MHLPYIPQCTIQNRNVHISVLNGALWDMGQVHCGISEIGLFVGRTVGFQKSLSIGHVISSVIIDTLQTLR